MSQERKDGISMVLARQMLTLVEESGASQLEAVAALGVVQSILPTLPISLVNAFGEAALPET